MPRQALLRHHLPCRRATITLLRHEWEQLVMERIAEFTDRVLVTEDLALACRQVLYGSWAWHCDAGCEPP
jgi:hypothetical protein